MSLNNIIKISAAGSGKTWDICHDALQYSAETQRKVLITTYTNRGADSIRNEIRKQNMGALSPHVVVKTWFEFLLSDLIRPYQNAMNGISINEVKSYDFSKMYGTINYNAKGSRQRYVTSSHLISANEASEFVLELNRLSFGRLFRRLEAVYDKIYFDEVQDLSGYDIEIVGHLIDSKMDVTCCGDNKQATYSTHNAKKYKKLTGANIWEFFSELEKQKKVNIQKNLSTRRFNSQICSFANKIFPLGDAISTIMTTETEHDGVFLIKSTDVAAYYTFYKPIVLRYDAKTSVPMYRTINFGACKGETFDRVLIFPNGPLKNFVLKNTSLSSPEKYYVAATRPRYSIAIVFDKLPKTVVDFSEIRMTLDGQEIRAMKYNAID